MVKATWFALAIIVLSSCYAPLNDSPPYLFVAEYEGAQMFWSFYYEVDGGPRTAVITSGPRVDVALFDESVVAHCEFDDVWLSVETLSGVTVAMERIDLLWNR